jgi:hypothetical protein
MPLEPPKTVKDFLNNVITDTDRQFLNAILDAVIHLIAQVHDVKAQLGDIKTRLPPQRSGILGHPDAFSRAIGCQCPACCHWPPQSVNLEGIPGHPTEHSHNICECAFCAPKKTPEGGTNDPPT